MGTPAYIIPIMGKTRFTNNKALDFDGSNEHLVIADNNVFSFPIASPFSITAEVYMDDATFFWVMTKGNSVGNQHEYVFGVDASDKLVIYLLNPANTAFTARIQNGTMTALQGSWIQIAATSLNNNLITDQVLYVNGSVVASTGSNFGGPTGMTNGTGPLRIARYFDNALYANGRIRRTTLWDKVLSTAEVAEDYDIALVTPRAFNTHSAYATNVIEYWDMGNNPLDVYPTIKGAKAGLDSTMTNMEAGDIIAYP